MAQQIDKADSTVRVTFREEQLYGTTVDDNAVVNTDVAVPKHALVGKMTRQKIKEKWLYIFWSAGREYEASSDPQLLMRRVSYLFAGQHMAYFGLSFKNPKPTKEKAQHAFDEVWIDEEGFPYRYPGDFAEAVKTPRHQRKHPKDEFKNEHGKEWKKHRTGRDLELPLRIDGQEIRYYFLLSSIRLGPKALEACLESGGGDGLSFWTEPWQNTSTDPATYATRVQAPAPDELEEIENLSNCKRALTPEEQKRYRELCEIGVVDPYHLAGDISKNLLVRASDRFKEWLESGDFSMLRQGGRKIDLKHFREPDYRGRFADLYFIAKTITGIRQQTKDSFKWDGPTAQQIIEFVEESIKDMHNAVEASAQFLANWLEGPAHRLIDLGVVHDTVGGRNERDREQDKQDQEYGLRHWEAVTSVLGNTSRGASYLVDLACARNPDNPVEALLLKYRDKEIDDFAFEMMCNLPEILPLLVLRWVLNDIDDLPVVVQVCRAKVRCSNRWKSCPGKGRPGRVAIPAAMEATKWSKPGRQKAA